MAKKKQKKSPEAMHRNIQDQVQAIPYAIDHLKKEGKPVRAFMLRYFSGPMLRMVNRIMNASRYRGPAGQKLKQTEQMRRALDKQRAVHKHVQEQMRQARKKKRMQ